MLPQNETTWADLDASNRNHYGRGKPALLLRCEETLQMAIEYNRIAETEESLDHVIALDAMKSYLYDRWQIEMGYNRHWSDDPRHYGEIEY